MSYKENGKYYTGYLDDLSDSQEKVLEEIRTWIQNELNISSGLYDDWNILRFCRARKFKVKAVKKMLLDYMKWLEDEKCLDILSEDMTDITSKMNQSYPHGYCTTSKNGNPVWIERWMDCDFSKILDVATEAELKRYFTRQCLTLQHIIQPKCSEHAGKRVEDMYFICDMKNTPMSKILSKNLIACVKLITKIGQDYFPEQMAKSYVINCPALFTVAWNIFKVLVDGRTRDKIKILGSGYKKVLHADIDPKNLPESLGGTGDIWPTDGCYVWNDYKKECYDAKTFFADGIEKADPLKYQLWKAKERELPTSNTFKPTCNEICLEDDVDENVLVGLVSTHRVDNSPMLSSRQSLVSKTPNSTLAKSKYSENPNTVHVINHEKYQVFNFDNDDIDYFEEFPGSSLNDRLEDKREGEIGFRGSGGVKELVKHSNTYTVPSPFALNKSAYHGQQQ